MRSLVLSLSLVLGNFLGVEPALAETVAAKPAATASVRLPLEVPLTLMIQSSVTAIRVSETLRNEIELDLAPGHGELTIARPSPGQMKLVVTSSDVRSLEVSVPKNFLAHLKIVSESGIIIVGGGGYETAQNNRRYELSTKSGSIIVQGRIWNEAEIGTERGDIFLGGNEGRVTVATLKGRIQVGSHTGQVQTYSTGGSLSMAEGVEFVSSALARPELACEKFLSGSVDPFEF